jgi:hypothetical protein
MNEYFDPCNDPFEEPDFTTTITFEDGSEIELVEFDEPIVTTPHRKIKQLWMAEEVANHIELHELDNVQAEQYITKNYKI